MPGTLLDYIGVIIGMFGLILCGLGMKAFRSVPKIFCLDAGQLTVSGVYRWSRNPQYVGWFLFLIGFAMNDWSLWCLASLTVVAVSLHLLVLIEEKHLRNEFGQLYVEFCRKVPRYFPLPRILQTALFNILLVFLCQTTMLNGNSGHKEASICHFSMNSNAVMSRG